MCSNGGFEEHSDCVETDAEMNVCKFRRCHVTFFSAPQVRVIHNVVTVFGVEGSERHDVVPYSVVRNFWMFMDTELLHFVEEEHTHGLVAVSSPKLRSWEIMEAIYRVSEKTTISQN